MGCIPSHEDVGVGAVVDPGQGTDVANRMTRGVEDVERPVAKIVEGLKAADPLLWVELDLADCECC